MKIRQGFVSNSSASSFVVRIVLDSLWYRRCEEFTANAEDIEKLKKFGFQPSNLTSPFLHEDSILLSEEDKHISMKYHVVCNQDEVLYFLVKNNIPFKASCHYQQEFVSYKKDSDYIFAADNFGLALDTYGEDLYDSFDMDRIREKAPFRKTSKEKWLEDNKWMENEEGTQV